MWENKGQKRKPLWQVYDEEMTCGNSFRHGVKWSVCSFNFYSTVNEQENNYISAQLKNKLLEFIVFFLPAPYLPPPYKYINECKSTNVTKSLKKRKKKKEEEDEKQRVILERNIVAKLAFVLSAFLFYFIYCSFSNVGLQVTEQYYYTNNNNYNKNKQY